MVPTILCVLFVTLLLRSTISFPVSQDVKSVQLSDSIGSVEPTVTERTFISDPDAILRQSEDSDKVKTVHSVTLDHVFDANSVKRTKRQVIDGYHNCPQGMVWFWNKCVTLEEYEELKEGDDYVNEN